jgi:hypothetical protein
MPGHAEHCDQLQRPHRAWADSWHPNPSFAAKLVLSLDCFGRILEIKAQGIQP